METGSLTFSMTNGQGPEEKKWGLIWLLLGTVGLLILFSTQGFAQVSIPGSDQSDRLEAAGSLLRLIDTGIFVWGARLFAALAVCAGAWNIKEMRFGAGILCFIAAIILGTVQLWVKNIFSMGGGGGIFSQRTHVERSINA